jgi:hypothetical protein
LTAHHFHIFSSQISLLLVLFIAVLLSYALPITLELTGYLFRRFPAVDFHTQVVAAKIFHHLPFHLLIAKHHRKYVVYLSGIDSIGIKDRLGLGLASGA